MSSSISTIEMYTLISEKKTPALFSALFDHFSNSNHDQLTELYSAALHCAAECKDEDAKRIATLLMKSVFTSENRYTIETTLNALSKGLKNDNSDFIDIVLGSLEPKLLQALLLQAKPELLAALLAIKSKLLQINEKDLLSLLDTAFKSNNIELATRILEQKPGLLAQLVENTKQFPNETVLAQIADKAPEAVIQLFTQAIENRNLELVYSLLPNIPCIQDFSKAHPDIMLGLLKDAIYNGHIPLVIAMLDKNPELLSKKIKSEGKKPAVLAAKLKQWDILGSIVTKHSHNHEDGDFHMALLWALQQNGYDFILNLDLSLICSSAETLYNEKNILHYAMSNNHLDLLKMIFSFKDSELLKALITNKNDDGENPIAYAANHRQWDAVALHAQMYIPQTEREYNTLYTPILEQAIAADCDATLSAALALINAASNMKGSLSPKRIEFIINNYLFRRENTKSESIVFSKLLNIHIAADDKPIHYQLDIRNTLFINNLLKIKDNISSELFKQLVSAREQNETAITQAAKESRWKDITELAKQYMPTTVNEYIDCGYFVALEKVIQGATAQELTAALALIEAADKISFPLDSNWLASAINSYLLKAKHTELEDKVFFKLLQLPIADADKPIGDNLLSVNEKFFIRNLLKININQKLFKQLVRASSNGKTAIEYALEQSRWEDITELAKKYTPENIDEYNKKGYAAALNKAISGTTEQELTAASALIQALKMLNYKYTTNWIVGYIITVIINKNVNDSLKNEVLSNLLDLCFDDETIVEVISSTACSVTNSFGNTGWEKRRDKLIERDGADINKSEIKRNVESLLAQITAPHIKLRVIMALLFNEKSSIWQTSNDKLWNGTRWHLIGLSTDILYPKNDIKNELPLEESWVISLFKKIETAISPITFNHISADQRIAHLVKLIAALTHRLFTNNAKLSENLLIALAEFMIVCMKKFSDDPGDYNSLYTQTATNLNVKSNVSFAMMLIFLLKGNEKMLKIALSILDSKPKADMAHVVINNVNDISAMLFNQPGDIQFAIFNRLLESCCLKKQADIIIEIAKQPSLQITETTEPKIMTLLGRINNPAIRINIVLNILATSYFSEEMKLGLIKGLIIEFNLLDPEEFKLEISNAIKTINTLNSGKYKAELCILQDFLRIILGDPSSLTELDGYSPEAAQAIIMKLYREIFSKNESLNSLFLKNLHGTNVNPESLVCQTIKPFLVSRKLSSKTVKTGNMAPEVQKQTDITEKATNMLMKTLPSNPVQSSSSIFSTFSGFLSSPPSSSSSSYAPAPSAPDYSAPVYPVYPDPVIDNNPAPSLSKIKVVSSASDSSSSSRPIPSNLSPSNSAPTFAMFTPTPTPPSSLRGTHSPDSIANLANAPAAPTTPPGSDERQQLASDTSKRVKLPST